MLPTLSFVSFFILLLLLLDIVALAQNSTPPAVNKTLPPTFTTSTFCRPNFYGVNVPVSSCLNAWAKIPRTSADIVFGSRGQRDIGVSIPLRYQSDDGWCVVELRARVRATTVRADVATAVEVSDAVDRVIEECVVRSSTGGSTTGFSSNHLLTVTVAGYRSEARCVPVARTPPPSPDSCYEALQTLPLGYYKTQFMGARDRPTRTLYARLPRWFSKVDASGQRCDVRVAKFPPDGFSMEAWYNIWVAGVDVFTTCIQRGMTGGVYELGDNGQVQIELGDTSVQIENA